MKRSLESFAGRCAYVGFPMGKVSSHLIAIAYWNHYGTRRNGKRHIPARRFMSDALKRARPEFSRKNGGAVQEFRQFQLSAISGAANVTGAWEKIAAVYKFAVYQAITEFHSPPNAPATIKEKGFDNPLIWTGGLRRSIAYRIA
jgi:hypothetical protein